MDDTLYDGTSLPPEDGSQQSPDPAEDGLEVPAGSPEERLAWVKAGEDQQTRYDRATAVYDEAKAAGEDEQALAALSGSLTGAVYGTPQTGEEAAASGETGTSPDAAPTEQPEVISTAAPEATQLPDQSTTPTNE